MEERRLKYAVYALLTPVVLVGLIAGAIALGCFCVALWAIEAVDAIG
jgi:hypothetical protein